MATRKVYFWHEDTNEVVWTAPAGSTPSASFTEAAAEHATVQQGPTPQLHVTPPHSPASPSEPQAQPEATPQPEDAEIGPPQEPTPEAGQAAVERLAVQLADAVSATVGPLPTILHLLFAACSMSGNWTPAGQAALKALRQDPAAVGQRLPELQQELRAWQPKHLQSASDMRSAAEEEEPGQLSVPAPDSPSDADMEIDPPAPSGSSPAATPPHVDVAAPPLPQENPTERQLQPSENPSKEPPLPEEPPEQPSPARPQGTTAAAAAARPAAVQPMVRAAAVLSAPRQLSPPPAAYALEAAPSLSPPRQLAALGQVCPTKHCP